MNPIQLDESQEAAVRVMLESSVSLITGGPGTGKTTLVRFAIEHFEAKGLDVGLASPTGKAAKRLSEATGREAQTVHRLLGYDPRSGGFLSGPDSPIFKHVVIVDEASMLDVELAHSLMAAVNLKYTKLIFVGDANQLPSVGPGNVFRDLLISGTLPMAVLKLTHRQGAGSWVAENAPLILQNKMPDLKERSDFWWVPCESKEDLRRHLVGLCAEGLKNRANVEHNDVQVLIPQRTGWIGCDAVNPELRARIAGPVSQRARMDVNGDALCVGDRVIQVRNDYDRAVFNGEIGIVKSASQEKLSVEFDGGPTVEYDGLGARSLQLAYALTVHKSQGSEWPWIVMVCHSSHSHMLTRRLLYTGITRARQGVVLIGDKTGLERAIRNTTDAKRNTALAGRLKAMAERKAA